MLIILFIIGFEAIRVLSGRGLICTAFGGAGGCLASAWIEILGGRTGEIKGYSKKGRGICNYSSWGGT
jgi:hypothetical protein